MYRHQTFSKHFYVVTSSSSCGLESLYGVTVVAVNHAVDYVNSNVNLLSGINLSHEAVKFTKVSTNIAITKNLRIICFLLHFHHCCFRINNNS